MLLLIVEPSLKKMLGLLTHMVSFSVASIVNQPLSGIYIIIYFCLCACNCCTSFAKLISMPLTHSSWPLVYVSVNGRDCVRVWVEKPSREMCVSILAGDLQHWRRRVAAAAAAWPTTLPISLSVSLTPGNGYFPPFIRYDLYFL